MIRIITFFIIIFIIYGFHMYYRNKEDFNDTLYTELEKIVSEISDETGKTLFLDSLKVWSKL